MLSLNRDVLSLVANQLSSQSIGCLRSVSEKVHDELGYSAKYAAISRSTDYSSEKCYETVNALSNYAAELVQGFSGLNTNGLQTYVDKKNSELNEDFQKITSDANLNQIQFKKRIENLKAKLADVETVGNQSLRLEWQLTYQAELTGISTELEEFGAKTEFARSLISKKRDLLLLEHLASYKRLNPESEFSEVPHEQCLIQNFRPRVEGEVKACGIESFDRAICAAKTALFNRTHLIPFTSSPATLSPYLHELEKDLVDEMENKYRPAPQASAAIYFDTFVSWIRRLSI